MSENLEFSENSYFKAYDWINHENEIRAWCIKKDNNRALLRIKDFYYPLYVECSFTDSKSRALEYLERKFGIYSWDSLGIKEKRFILRKQLYGFNNILVPYLVLYFENYKAALEFSKKNFARALKIHESEFSWSRKLWSRINLKPSQWFFCRNLEAIPDEEKISNLQEEYFVSYKDIEPISFEKTLDWKVDFRILTFDIECYSSDEKKMPDPLNLGDEIFLISFLFEEASKKKIILLALEKKENQELRSRISKDFENVEIYFFAKERALVKGFQDIISKYDPDILSGYNITNFDFDFLNFRMDVRMQPWNSSRLKQTPENCFKQITWESSAFGEMRISYPRLEGRIVIDMLTFFKRNYNNLEFYNLKYVSKKFLQIEKIDLSPIEMFQNYRSFRDGQLSEQEIKQYEKIIEYNIRDSELVSELISKTNCIIVLTEMSNILQVNLEEILIYGQQRKFLSQLYNKAKEEKIVLNKVFCIQEDFKGASVFEAKPGIYENVICFDFASLYPSIVMAYNICYTTFRGRDLEPEENPENFHEIQVETKEDIIKLYFVKASIKEGLIPSLMRNLVSERKKLKLEIAKLKSLIGTLEEDQRTSLLRNCITLDAREQSLKISANSIYGSLGSKDSKFPFFEGAMAITAIGRLSFKEVAKQLEDNFQAKQVYGDTDSVMVQLPFLTSPKDCNYWGRKLAEFINGLEPGSKDCDGNLCLQGKPSLFPKPMCIEFEKAMKMILFTKKRYAAFFIEKDGSFKMDSSKHKEFLLCKGIMTVRRDNCRFLKELYSELIYLILRGENFENIFLKILIAFKDLYDGKVPIELLAKVQEVKSEKNYKSKTAFMVKFKEKIKQQGYDELLVGERIQFVFIKLSKSQEEKKASCAEKARLLEHFNRLEDEIDYDYYVENLAKKQFEQLLLSAYSRELEEYQSLSLKPKNKKNPIVFSKEPIGYFLALKKLDKGWFELLKTQLGF